MKAGKISIMKSLKEFSIENNALSANKMCKVLGGQIIKTTWHDLNGPNSGTDTSDSKTDLGDDAHLDE